MHILFFSHYFAPEGNAPANRTYENCRLWAQEGHDVTVITCAPNVPNGIVYDGYKNKLIQRQTMDGIKVIRVWTYIAANKGTIRRIINYLSYMLSSVFFSLLRKKPDVIIATSPQFFCGWAGLIAARLKNVPFILEVRDIWPESIAAVGAIKNKRILRMLERLEIKMYKAAEHIITLGEGYKKKLLEKNVPEGKITVIPNGIDPEIFQPAQPSRQIIQKYNLEGKFVCSYIGTLGMASGLEVVIESAGELQKQNDKSIVFLLVGDGAEKESLQQKAVEKNIDNITFTGRVDKELIPDYLSVTNACLIHLKKTELFKTVLPSKIFEACAMSKPIILGIEGFAAELVKKANAGVCIEPENPKQLLDAVKKLSQNPDLCRSLGANGREFVIRNHDRKKLAAEFLALIDCTHREKHPLPTGGGSKENPAINCPAIYQSKQSLTH
jgi:glycosyltransferase involved in cell wall biosynthesis